VPLTAAVKRALKLRRSILHDPNIKVAVDLRPPPRAVRGQEVLLEQVLSNILLNARDALTTRPDGAAELDIRFTNDAWGGTAATDRNLYVDSVALNGVDLHAQAALLSAGDAVFAF